MRLSDLLLEMAHIYISEARGIISVYECTSTGAQRTDMHNVMRLLDEIERVIPKEEPATSTAEN